MRAEQKRAHRIRRHKRVRKHVSGTAERPRLAVFRSNRHIYAQLVDDTAARTLVAASDVGTAEGDDKTARARQVGKALAERAKAAGVERAVFDRGGRLYHGRVQALAEGAREGGLEI
jgi:large subunit ribosomal protein L18